MLVEDFVIYQGATFEFSAILPDYDFTGKSVTLKIFPTFCSQYDLGEYEYEIEEDSVISATDTLDMDIGFYSYQIFVDDTSTVSLYKSGKVEIQGQPVHCWRNS